MRTVRIDLWPNIPPLPYQKSSTSDGCDVFSNGRGRSLLAVAESPFGEDLMMFYGYVADDPQPQLQTHDLDEASRWMDAE